MKKLTPFFLMVIFLITAVVFAETEIPAISSTVNPGLNPGKAQLILTAVGDINFHSIDGLVIKDPEFPWRGTIDVLKKASVLVGNLEA
ncbi:MAG: hypothetical protein ACM3YE_16200, partial [Bacteroidota bacterium]